MSLKLIKCLLHITIKIVPLFVLKIFQHLEHNTPFMKVIEYSIAGKSFVTSEIFEKISMKKHISAIEKFFNSLLLFKVCIYILL